MSRHVTWSWSHSFLALLLSAATAGAAIDPLPLGPGANSVFSDEKPDDRQGGWTDQGGNDLRALKAGSLKAAAVPFTVQAGAAADGRTCIVLGGPARPYLPQQAVVPLANVRGQFLYLLHAAAWCPPAKEQKMTGVLFLDYIDGTSAEIHVRFGRDVGDWTKPDSFKNAARGWTVYNGNTQVSLFVSRFAVKKDLPLKALRFEARESTWMIAAASLGDETELKPIKADLTLDKTYAAPPPLSPPLAATATSARPKNIILLIGDGMGDGALQLTSLYQHQAEGALVMQQFPVSGHCTTNSLPDKVTDSAAAATALATGHKTDNGSIGLTPDNRRLTPFTELAQRAGRRIGLITSDALTGATPAGFYAHVDTRGSFQGVADDAARCGYEVLIGNANARGWFLPKTKGGQRSDERDLIAEMTASGYQVCESIEAFAAVPAGQRALGFMAKGTLDAETSLAQLTETALGRLAREDPGFFLMVECTITDGGGHNNNPELTVRGTLQVDWAARTAAEFARRRGDTLVIVTADHETGGLSARRDGKLHISYSTTSHTSAPVPVFAYGPGAERFAGKLDNTDIAKHLSQLWQLDLPPPAALAGP
jgi:alkaline phosphatase